MLFLVYRENLGLGPGETPGKLNPLTEKDPEKSMQLCLHKSDPHLWPYRARLKLSGTKGTGNLAFQPQLIEPNSRAEKHDARRMGRTLCRRGVLTISPQFCEPAFHEDTLGSPKCKSQKIYVNVFFKKEMKSLHCGLEAALKGP